jgi:hypothetical protein
MNKDWDKIARMLEAFPDMLSALHLAKDWMDDDFDKKMTKHDMNLYDKTMGAINNAIQQATQP